MSSMAKGIRLEPADGQETTIEKLCDDVSEEIFSYLSAADLKSASLVCKNWNEVIGSSARTMKKFKLKLKEIEMIGEQFRTTRNHQNIELQMLATGNGPPSDQKSLENLDRLYELSDVKYFKIFAYNWDTDPIGQIIHTDPIQIPWDTFAYRSDNPWKTFSIDAMKLTPALKQMKQLQELFIECPAGFRGSFTSTIDLPKLTKLAVKSPDWSIFQWISASNVTEIDLLHQSYGRVGVQHLASFLMLCKQITTLKLDSNLVRDLFVNGKWRDFNLKLSGLDINATSNPDVSCLREFLISQAPSLTSLSMKEVPYYLSGPEDVSVTEAMSRLKNLKILSLDYFFEPDETFLRQMTELEQLTLHTTKDINDIARFNQKLTYLKIGTVENSLDAALEFSELKHLCVGVDHSLNCLKVIKSSPRVETIELIFSFRYFDDTKRCKKMVKAALQQPTLRHLKLEFWNITLNFDHLEKAFDKIASDYGNLKSLIVRAKVGPALRSLKFFFPENRSDWNANEQKMRLSETFANK